MVDAGTSRDSIIADVVRFWRIHQRDGKCQTSPATLLWFVSFFVFAAAWSFILGASDVRKYIKRRAKFFSSTRDVRLRVALTVGGSLLLQLGISVATAQMLRNASHADLSSPAPPLSGPLIVWFIRPLPATVVSLTGLISPTTYMKNGLEIQFVEAW